MRNITTRTILGISIAAAIAGCTVKDVDQPALSGPSTLAHSIVMVADRDTLQQNGSDFTDIRVTSLGPTGQSENVALRAQIFVDNVAQDFGTLSTKSLLTPTTFRYTAPSASTLAAGQVPTRVTIAVTSSSSGDFRGEVARQLDIQLVPQGVILPTNPSLVAGFTITPASPQVFQTVTFDAATSTNNGAGCASACTYTWNFGDGTSGTGITATHVYRTIGTFAVTLTLTDARGAQTILTKSVTVGNLTQPSGTITTSPASNLATGVDIFFSASGITWTGRNIVSYDWNWGDGTAHGSGVTATHRYAVAGSFTVTLTVTDDLGATGQISTTFTISTLGGATADLTASTQTPASGQRVIFDATKSVPSAGGFITNYKFIYGDGGEEDSTQGIQSHVYTGAKDTIYTATVVITDSNGKTATKSVPITMK